MRGSGREGSGVLKAESITDFILDQIFLPRLHT